MTPSNVLMTPSRIVYLTNARLPTDKAHGLATAKLCEALAKRGVALTIVAPRRFRNPTGSDLYGYYDVARVFDVVTLPCLDFLRLGVAKRLAFIIELASFSCSAFFWLAVRRRALASAVIFSHDHLPLFVASFLGLSIAYDVHHYPHRSWLYQRVLGRALVIAVQTKWKVGALEKDFGLPRERIVYWPNGTDVERFKRALPRAEARAALGLPPDLSIALYTGQLFAWKGVGTLVDAARFLPGAIRVYIVGGGEAEIARMRGEVPESSKVSFFGQRPWREIPLWLKAADVLVLPNTGRAKVARLYTSPMKLFEYLASGTPIVASDIPSVREIVDDRTAVLVRPDDPLALAEAIRRVIADPAAAARRAAAAQTLAAAYTWDARASRILDALGAALRNS